MEEDGIVFYCLLYILKRCLNIYIECGNDGFLVLDLVVCESISFFGCKCVFIYGLFFVKYNFI